MIQNEEWKPVAGFEGWYEVSSHGRVRSLDRTINAPNRWGACKRTLKGKVLSPRRTDFGHRMVGLRREGALKGALVHRLVCEAFHGPCPPDKQHCAHRDGNPENNRADNLRWATVRENSEDARRHGTLLQGEASNLSRLTEADVLEIRRRSAAGATGYRLAKDYKMSATGIYKILHRENWKHI